MRLKDKVAIITGGAMGIGRELALGLAGEGADVVAADISIDKTDSLVKQFAEIGRKCLPIKTDVSKRAEVQAMVDKTIDEFGKIDILINNAAIYPAVPFLEWTDEGWNKVVDIGLNGTFICSQIAAREMAKKQYGKIINVSSTQGLLGIPMSAAYTAVKGAVIALTREMAAELGPVGINVNCISPGLTTTANAKDVMPEELMNYMGAAVPLRRLASPSDYVGIAVFLSSDESKYSTGATFAVDGGLGNVMMLPPG